MSLLTVEPQIIYESICTKLLENRDLNFVGVVNNKGRIIAGQFGKIYANFENKNQFEMFLMEIALEFSMKHEFNNKFGLIEYVFSKRRSANIFCMPINEAILVIISENYFEPGIILEKCLPVLETSFKDGNKVNESL
jgi:hypothetical protein